MRKKAKKFSGAEGSYILPAQVRTFAETVAGKRDPITEKNFSAAELQQMRDAIARSRARQASAVEYQKSKGREGLYDETVDYSDYGEDRKRQKNSLLDFSPLPGEAARNTLGRFRYQKTPEGRLVALDSYDFKDDLADKLPGIPRSKDYEQLSTLQKLGKLAADTFDTKTGGIRTLPSRAGSAFVGAASRPVRVDLGEAPFKKGGRVKQTSRAKRGDGIITKGFTKGKVR